MGDSPLSTTFKDASGGIQRRAIPATDILSTEKDLAVIEQWLWEYVSAPHPELGRSGPVCPFVPPAMNNNLVQFSLRYDVDNNKFESIYTVIQNEMSDFGITAKPAPNSGASLESRLVVFPLLGEEGCRRLDEHYTALKNEAVESGLMIGQFHPYCDERAVRNQNFRVSISPIPFLAMRRMAPHDVLFLHEERNWFENYHQNFSSHHERGRVRDPLLRKLHLAGETEYGLETSNESERRRKE